MMGYYTYHTLEWKPQTEVTTEPNCRHLKDMVTAKFCPECGLPVRTVDISHKISEYLGQNAETYYGINRDGMTEDRVKWYSHETDMRVLSKVFSTYLFIMSGEGEESGDIWREYYLNGKMQRAEAKITYDEFDKSKLM